MFAAIRSVLFRYLRGKRFEEGLSEELRFHLESRTEDLVRSGLPRPEAERQARLGSGRQLSPLSPDRSPQSRRDAALRMSRS